MNDLVRTRPIKGIEESGIDARIGNEKQGRERGETNAQTGYDPATRDVHVRGKQAGKAETHQNGNLPNVRIAISEFGENLPHDRKCHAHAGNSSPVQIGRASWRERGENSAEAV